MIELKSPDKVLDMGELNFDDENSDLNSHFGNRNNLGEYSTENVQNPAMNKILGQQVQDGLPTIFEKSQQQELHIVKNRTHNK